MYRDRDTLIQARQAISSCTDNGSLFAYLELLDGRTVHKTTPGVYATEALQDLISQKWKDRIKNTTTNLITRIRRRVDIREGRKAFDAGTLYPKVTPQEAPGYRSDIRWIVQLASVLVNEFSIKGVSTDTGFDRYRKSVETVLSKHPAHLPIISMSDSNGHLTITRDKNPNDHTGEYKGRNIKKSPNGWSLGDLKSFRADLTASTSNLTHFSEKVLNMINLPDRDGENSEALDKALSLVLTVLRVITAQYETWESQVTAIDLYEQRS